MQAFKTDIPPLLAIVRENNEKYIFKCIFSLLNFMTKTNGKAQVKKFQMFLKQIIVVFVKTFSRKWEGEFLPK